MKQIHTFITDHNRRALEWQIWFLSSPSSESELKDFQKNFEKIKKNWFSFEQAHRFWKLFFFNESGLEATKKTLKLQKTMIDELLNNMKLLATKSIEKKISTLANEISYTQAKTLSSPKELLRFIRK
jgi:hypothetical protein